jgi:endonuclease/exonuclease/phosphatase family metal-dependent hydrolase
MKITSLNIWGGKMYEPLMEFIKSVAADTDIFCFQEVFQSESDIISNGLRMDIFGNLAKELSAFDGYFTSIWENHDFSKRTEFAVKGGDAIFVRNSISIKSHGSFFVYGTYNDVVIRDGKIDFPVTVQYIRFEHNSQPLVVAHLHGIVHPGTKLDSPARLEQSRNIIDFLSKEPGEKILCGDFNLMPETESIKMIEKSGLRNLIKDFQISTTRGSLGVAKYPDSPQYFADYSFVSSGIKVKNFIVPDLPISDHLPMILFVL